MEGNEQVERSEQLLQIRNYIHSMFYDDASGHDYFHMERVAKMAIYISTKESANHFICEAAGWLHDIGDDKLFTDPQKALKNMEIFLHSINLSNSDIRNIKTAMEDVSYSKGRIPRTFEGKIVQDADRLDALGAIGIARTFAFGGSKGRAMFHDTDIQGTSIQHFYDKLLILKDTIHTATAKEIAHERHDLIHNYLQQFLKEWDVKLNEE